jgi:hypothetical protein
MCWVYPLVGQYTYCVFVYCCVATATRQSLESLSMLLISLQLANIVVLRVVSDLPCAVSFTFVTRC